LRIASRTYPSLEPRPVGLAQARRDDEVGEIPADGFASRVAELPLGGRAELEDRALMVDDDDAVEPRLEDIRHRERVAMRAPATRVAVRWIKRAGASDLQPDS